MDLDLKAFSLTLAVGFAVIGMIWAGVFIFRPHSARRWLYRLRFEKGRPQVIPAVVVAIGALSLGIVSEDLSKNAVSRREPVAFGPQLRAVMPTEETERCLSMFDEINDECSDFEATSSKLVPVHLGRLGAEIWETLNQLEARKRGTPEEMLTFVRWRQLVDPKYCRPEIFKEDPKTSDPLKPVLNKRKTQFGVCGLFSPELKNLFYQVYYVAKNFDYQIPDLFKELEALRVRIDFERSLAYVLLVGIYGVSFAYLFECTRALYADVGGWKKPISLILGTLVLFAAADIIHSPHIFNSACQFDTHCAVQLQNARNGILPACFLFVCVYRTRRLWRRAAPWIAWPNSTVPGPPLLSHRRELEAGRALLVSCSLATLLAPIDFAYRSDQFNYLSRVYGYYESQRGVKLECHVKTTSRQNLVNIDGLSTPPTDIECDSPEEPSGSSQPTKPSAAAAASPTQPPVPANPGQGAP